MVVGMAIMAAETYFVLFEIFLALVAVRFIRRFR